MTNPVIDTDGTRRWFSDTGRLHRLDGPAVEYSDGTKQWWVDGRSHRLDGPAFENPNQKYIPGRCWWWWVNDVNIDDEVITWFLENGILWTPGVPLDDDTVVLFKLRFG